MRRPALWATLVLAALVAVGVFAQVYLIASYLFGADSLDAHRDIGFLVHTAEILVFVAGAVAWWKNWPKVAAAFTLALVGTVQIGFVEGEKWVGGVHGLLALVVLGIATHLVVAARRDLSGSPLTEPPPPRSP